jgi:hypothetical protein
LKFAARLNQVPQADLGPLVDKKKEYSKEEFERFLEFECRYKKYEGKTWGFIMTTDPHYFKWCLTHAMPVTTKTWKVLSAVLSDEDRVTTFERANWKRKFKTRQSKRKRTEEDKKEEDLPPAPVKLERHT